MSFKYVFVSFSHKSLTKWNTSLPPYLHIFFLRINCLSNFSVFQYRDINSCVNSKSKLNTQQSQSLENAESISPLLFCDFRINLWHILPSGQFYEIFCSEKRLSGWPKNYIYLDWLSFLFIFIQPVGNCLQKDYSSWFS